MQLTGIVVGDSDIAGLYCFKWFVSIISLITILLTARRECLLDIGLALEEGYSQRHSANEYFDKY